MNKNVLFWVAAALPLFATIGSGSAKLARVQMMVDKLTPVHFGDSLWLLGLMELTFAGLFIYAPSRKLGLLLLTGYFGGAIAVDIATNNLPIPTIVILSLFWVAAYIWDKHIFLPNNA